jgi:glycosyltransferase involved in cell wall biosynthesis
MDLVSVIIPTKNSSTTISSCLKSVKNQIYPHIDIIIVDANSTDGTAELCEENNAKVFKADWKTLGARYIGLLRSSGEYILMLDSDQFLEQTCIQRCLSMMKEYDMLCLEEKTYNPKTIIEKMYEADRRLIHDQADLQLDPLYGALAPRFYRRTILEKVFAAIPKEILPFTKASDDAIVYYEASKLSNKVGILPNALWHKEPESLIELWYKNHGYGKSAHQLLRTGHYSLLLSKKLRLRKSKGLSKNKILSSILLLLKAPAYIIGFYRG